MMPDLVPVLSPVLGVGNSSQTPPGYCCVAPTLVEDAKQALALCRSQPVADPDTMFFHSLHPPDSCRQVGTEQPTIGSLVRKAADSRQTEVNMVSWRLRPRPGTNTALLEGSTESDWQRATAYADIVCENVHAGEPLPEALNIKG
jgi:hypothetical protein